MEIIIYILAFLNGAYMLTDGIYVLIKGKYIGPEKPGPWATLLSKFKINVFKLGPMFILYGILWLIFLWGFIEHYTWANTFGIIISILTLWYLSVGTLFSLIILLLILLH